jgi:hypothetical protein
VVACSLAVEQQAFELITEDSKHPESCYDCSGCGWSQNDFLMAIELLVAI